MKIGFFIEGEDYLGMAGVLVESARREMPDVPVYQLTNGTCPAIEGVEVIRIPGDIPMGTRRIMHYTALEGDWLLVGADVVFLKDVRHVFEKPFEIAMASRDGTYLEGSDYARVMPYNFDVVFSRSPAFWKCVLEVMKKLPQEHQRWGGEQCVTGYLAKDADLHVLPHFYNYTPESRLDPLEGVAILHLKGKRKTWLPELRAA